LGLDLVLPPGHLLWLGDVTESYRFIGAAWARTLRRFGIPARLVDVPTARVAPPDDAVSCWTRLVCFGSLSPYEITVDGRKLVGLAQVRRRHGVLLQGALLYASGVDLLASVLQLPARERQHVRDALTQRIVGLDELATDLPSRDAVASA
jgi:lipoate-protein ligase A